MSVIARFMARCRESGTGVKSGSSVPIAIWAVALRPDHVIDGDTMRYSGEVYRLVGFDTPERADNVRSDDECRRAQGVARRH